MTSTFNGTDVMMETDSALPGNSSMLDTENDSRDEYLAIWEVTTLAIIFVLAFIGNCLVILSLYLRRYHGPRKKHTRMYFFILHLSIADLLTALLSVLPQLFWEITFRFQGGPILCKGVKFGQLLGPYLSSYVLTATALDRYQAICHPLNYCSVTSRRSRVMVYSAWAISLIFCLPQVFIFSYQEISPGVWDCWATFDLPYGQEAYVTWYSVSVFILPWFVLLYTYASICIAIWRNTGIAGEAQRGNAGLLRQRTIISSAKIKSIKQMIAVISLYATCSSPFISSLLWVTWDPEAQTSPFFAGAAFTILTLLSSLNSCVNPWIYLSLNPELCQMLLKMVSPLTNYRYQRNLSKSNEIRSSSSISSKTGKGYYTSRISRWSSLILRRPSEEFQQKRNSDKTRGQ